MILKFENFWWVCYTYNDIVHGGILLEKVVKSKDRVKEFGEVFTPSNIVKDMCDLGELKVLTYDIEATFLEPACGNGNFLVEVLKRKLESVKTVSKTNEEFDINIIKSVCSMYGVDIQLDNILEARERLTGLITDCYKNANYVCSEDMTKSIDFVLCRNIIVGNTLKAEMAAYKPNRRGGRQSGVLSERLQFFEWRFKGQYVTRVVNRLIARDSMELVEDNSLSFEVTKYNRMFDIPRGCNESTSIY